MMLFGASSDLITLFVILEMISLPLYILAATARHPPLLAPPHTPQLPAVAAGGAL